MRFLKAARCLLFMLCLVFSGVYAQKEVDNWIFGKWAGLNFSTGDPVPIFVNPQTLLPGFIGVIMSDSAGNILFYSNGDYVWNKNNEVMPNGNGLLPEQQPSRQGAIAFPKPGFDDHYYLFCSSHQWFPGGLYYSVIDMSLDDGLGDVSSLKNIKLEAADLSAEQLFALENDDGSGYWVITRLYNDDRYVSFQVDINGVNSNPVYSSHGIYRELGKHGGNLKVSPDKKHLVASYWSSILGNTENIEICSFNNSTGQIDYEYFIARQWTGPNSFSSPTDIEFSPDSKYLYVSYNNISTWTGWALYQYDMQYVDDSSAFHNSGILVSGNSGMSLQLSNDGRIYASVNDITSTPPFNKYLSVINKPWEPGTACDYDTTSVYCGGRDVNWDLPNILLDYLYRFEWEGDQCQFSPITFKPNFRPVPDSVRWFFDEFAPGNVSNDLSPTYAFQNPGIHEVEVDIWYPTGRFEHTSREIEIYPTPKPKLGPDTVICPGASLTLSANYTADMYSWSTEQFGPSQITVSDSGAYWVKAWFLETGCTGYDTIHVGLHPSTTIDETDLVITPTACNGTNGSITGLYALGATPFAYQWLDLSGNPFSNNIDATGLPAGQYYLTITDANGCQVTSPVYTVHDAGDLQVTQVQADPAHCHRSDGRLVISAWSPSGSAMEYSINDGQDYQPDSIFENLPSGDYIVRIRDINGCEGFYDGNPVILTDIPGPQVSQTIVTNESDGQQNGAIEITAAGSTPTIYFSVDTLSGWQPGDGLFENLSAGTYTCVVRDENGCDTVFTVEIQNIILTYLQAVTGPGSHCLGNAATVPVEVDNFTSVAEFQLKISYNKDNLQCEGYANVHPELAGSFTGWVDVAAGEITLQWSGMSPVTFAGQQTAADLVFTTVQAGPGLLDWYTGPEGSLFTNPQGDPIPAEFHTGQVNVYQPPQILLSPEKTVCEGQMVSIMGIASGNQPPISYLWIYPDGSTTVNDPFFFATGQADAGDYTLLATDAMGCTDEKTVRLVVEENPVAAFHGADTLEVDPGFILSAGTGLAYYLWNTGDTTESIVIIAEGMYTVGMESLPGCVGMDSIYLKINSEEILTKYFYIPNAFTPDGDGRNDVFKPVPANPELSIVNCRLSIFDRWGGLMFEGDGISVGWDGMSNGKPCPVGVYVYRLTFRVDGVPGVEGEQVLTGTVALVR